MGQAIISLLVKEFIQAVLDAFKKAWADYQKAKANKEKVKEIIGESRDAKERATRMRDFLNS